MAYYSRRHYSLVSPAADTKDQIADRLRDNAALALARADVETAFPVITADNVRDALAFTEQRIKARRAETMPEAK